AIARRVGSRDVSLWFADGSNYPGTQNMRRRKQWFEEQLRAAHALLEGDERLLVEYKPFEPAFYHTDVADWGMALHFARAAGPPPPPIFPPQKPASRPPRGPWTRSCSASSISTTAGTRTTT